jgi:hypothetical protein
MKLKAPFFILIVVVFSSCVEVIDLDLPNKEKKLVVDGLVLDTNSPYTVTLSKTGKYNFKYVGLVREFETNATVIISDSEGVVDTLKEISSGVYRSDSTKLIGKVGNTYTLDIFTAENKHYRSHPETMLSVPPIDKIFYTRDRVDINPENQKEWKFTIFCEWQDPAAVRNYYLRSISYYWSGAWHDNVQWNWVFDDKYIDGIYLKEDFLTDGYGGAPFTVQLKQLSLTERAYEFWILVHQQTQGVDGETTNVEVPLTGNVYNVDDPDDQALGYFQASSINITSVYLKD